VRNVGTSTIDGPVQIVFSSLPASVTLANASGTHNDSPYITISTTLALAPGQTAAISVQFSNPSNAQMHFTTAVYSGSFN
jgi:hypothetical protein